MREIENVEEKSQSSKELSGFKKMMGWGKTGKIGKKQREIALWQEKEAEKVVFDK